MKLLFNFGFLNGVIFWDDEDTSNDMLTSEFYKDMNTVAMELGLDPEGKSDEEPFLVSYNFCTTQQLQALKETILQTRIKL